MTMVAVRISHKALLGYNTHAIHLDLVKNADFDAVHLRQGCKF